jgi:hypothetical protein
LGSGQHILVRSETIEGCVDAPAPNTARLLRQRSQPNIITALDLNRQRPIENKPAATRNSAHLRLLLAVRSQLKFLRLIALHAKILNPDLLAHNTIS